MTLTEFISALQAIREEHGDLRCWREAFHAGYPRPMVVNHLGRPYRKPRPGETSPSMESVAAVYLTMA